jgi:hypothetical protein
VSIEMQPVYSSRPTPSAQIDGWQCFSENSCRDYFKNRVRDRLMQCDATAVLSEYLSRIPATGFTLDNLVEQIQPTRSPRDWEVGEAFAEVILEDLHNCRFPWPTSKDHREDMGHPTGPDLPGFHLGDSIAKTRFAFGEVKSSSQKTSPPLAVLGIGDKCKKDDFVGQLLRLLQQPSRRQQLISWLQHRCANHDRWGGHYDSAFQSYFGCKAATIWGCLIRGGCEPDIADLQVALDELAALCGTIELRLNAFYLPFKKSDWPELLDWPDGGEA